MLALHWIEGTDKHCKCVTGKYNDKIQAIGKANIHKMAYQSKAHAEKPAVWNFKQTHRPFYTLWCEMQI